MEPAASCESRDAAPRKAILAVLIGLCVLAAVLRLAGVDRLLPHLPEPDTFLVLQLQSLRHDPAMIPHEEFYERYPLLIARSLALLPFDLPSEHIDPAAGAAEHLRAAAHPYVEVRTLSALMGVLLVPLTWLLARRFLGAGGALWAAFFVATSALHILYSQQGRPHVTHATLALGAVLAALAFHDRPTGARALLAAATAGLALAALQSGAFALAPLAVALWLSPMGGGGSGSGGRYVRRALHAGVAVVVALAIAAPFYPTLPTIEDGRIVLAQRGGHTLDLDRFNGAGLWRSVHLLWMHDPLLVVLCSAGLLVTLMHAARHFRSSDTRERGAAYIVLAYVVPYGLVIALQSTIYDRFLIPLLPYIGGASAALIVWVFTSAARALDAGVVRTVVLGASALLVAAFPASIALHYSTVAVAPDTLEQSAAWFANGWRDDAHNPDPERGAIATSAILNLPLLYSPSALAIDTADPGSALAPWLAYQRLIPTPADARDRYDVRVFPSELALESGDKAHGGSRRWLESVRPQYAVLELTPKMVFIPALAELREAVLERGTLVFRSSGDEPNVPFQGPINYQDVKNFVPRILSARAFGPGIEIYRLAW